MWFAIAAAMLLGFAAPVQGAFLLVEDFDGLTQGDIAGQNGWVSAFRNTGATGSFDVVTNPASGQSGQALINNATGVGVSKTFSSDGLTGFDPLVSTGTLFFSVYLTALTTGTSVGLTDNAPDAFDDYRSQIAFNSGITAVSGTGTGSSLVIDNVPEFTTGTWYNIWMVAGVVDGANTWKAYIQGGDITEQRRLSSGGVDTFNFRTGGGFINTFMVGKGGQTANTFYMDNVYIDPTGENLSVIPEPSTYALLAFGSLLGLVCWRFSRRAEAA